MNEPKNSLEIILYEGLKTFNQQDLTERLWHYLLLLNKWNATYNLTAIRQLDDMIYKHLLDSLAIMPWVQGNKIIDVGSGAGLPGIPLALALPQTQFVLLDSKNKKTLFLKEVKRQLSIDNIEIVQTRVENYHPDSGFDTVLSRAFSEIQQMIQWTQHLIAPNGNWLAMKGRIPHAELAQLTQNHQVHPYSVNGLGERCCVLIQNIKKE